MSSAARQSPKFPWDYDVPDDAFWSDIDHQLAGSFLRRFTEDEISQMTFDASLSKADKLRYLQGKLEAKLHAKEALVAPSLLRDADRPTWSGLKHVLSTIYHSLGKSQAAEDILRELSSPGSDGARDIGALHGLGYLLEQDGRHAEAEVVAREVLPLIQGIKTRDMTDSPQAIGTMRLLVKSIWRQGRISEAQEWIAKCRETIERMGTGPFAKYQEEEVEELEEVMTELEG